MASTQSQTWDLEAVFRLSRALSHQDEPAQRDEHSRGRRSNSASSAESQGSSASDGLGDFSKIYALLGLSDGTAAPSLAHLEAPPAPIFDKEAYASDGGIQYPQGVKTVSWKDDVDGESLEETLQITTGEVEGKKKKKKKSKKKNKTKSKAAKGLVNDAIHHTAREYDSEGEPNRRTETPARKASTHVIPPQADNTDRHGVCSKNSLAVLSNHEETDQRTLDQAIAYIKSETAKKDATLKMQPGPASPDNQNSGVQPTKAIQQANGPTSKNGITNAYSNVKKQWPISNPYTYRPPTTPTKAESRCNVSDGAPKPLNNNDTRESSAAAVVIETPQHISRAPNTSSGQILPAQTPIKRNRFIGPIEHQSLVDRNLALFWKLLRDFPEDKASLVSPMALSNHSTSPSGIHVFVDASNIFIGFHDYIKRKRGIPQYARVPRVPMSFHAFALLIERRRPVAKRVLVGSAPSHSSFDEAKEIGYETNILHRVLKAKELTERQKRFQNQQNNGSHSHRRSNSGGQGSAVPVISTSPKQQNGFIYSYDGSGSYANVSASAASSGNEKDIATHAPARYIEQGVDEILHLKMVESIVDCAPSTMVLATGDAAEAEYSEGFLKMVVRALKVGWKVELVSWKKNISFAWRKVEFQHTWGERFRIIELDEYVEELLDMTD